MAAATVTAGGKRPRVLGDIAMVTATITLAGTGDTLAASQFGFADLINVIATPPSSVAVTPNISGTTITFNYTGGGAMTGVIVSMLGNY